MLAKFLLRAYLILANLGLLLSNCGSVFLSGIFLICWETIAMFRDPPAMLGENLSQKRPPTPSLKPKNVTGVATKRPRIFVQFCQMADSEQNIPNPKKDCKNIYFEKA